MASKQRQPSDPKVSELEIERTKKQTAKITRSAAKIAAIITVVGALLSVEKNFSDQQQSNTSPSAAAPATILTTTQPSNPASTSATASPSLANPSSSPTAIPSPPQPRTNGSEVLRPQEPRLPEVPSSPYEHKLIKLPSDSRIYFVKEGQRWWVGNGAVLKCIQDKASAGNFIDVTQQQLDSHPKSSRDAYCPYEEAGINFVSEDGSWVWLVHKDGTKQHVAPRACVEDPFDSSVPKKWRAYPADQHETDGHRQIGDFHGDPTACNALPG